MIISKKKEQLRSPLLAAIEDEIKTVSKRLNSYSTSLNYKENHNLPEFDYQGIQPFSLENLGRKLEESKVGSLGINDRNEPDHTAFKEFNYSKAVDKLKLDEMDI